MAKARHKTENKPTNIRLNSIQYLEVGINGGGGVSPLPPVALALYHLGGFSPLPQRWL